MTMTRYDPITTDQAVAFLADEGFAATCIDHGDHWSFDAVARNGKSKSYGVSRSHGNVLTRGDALDFAAILGCA